MSEVTSMNQVILGILVSTTWWWWWFRVLPIGGGPLLIPDLLWPYLLLWRDTLLWLQSQLLILVAASTGWHAPFDWPKGTHCIYDVLTSCLFWDIKASGSANLILRGLPFVAQHRSDNPGRIFSHDRKHATSLRPCVREKSNYARIGLCNMWYYLLYPFVSLPPIFRLPSLNSIFFQLMDIALMI